MGVWAGKYVKQNSALYKLKDQVQGEGSKYGNIIQPVCVCILGVS